MQVHLQNRQKEKIEEKKMEEPGNPFACPKLPIRVSGNLWIGFSRENVRLHGLTHSFLGQSRKTFSFDGNSPELM